MTKETILNITSKLVTTIFKITQICKILIFELFFRRGRELQERLADREAEIEMDNRDRQKEKEELEELKAKIYAGESNNPEVEFAKVIISRRQNSCLFIS